MVSTPESQKERDLLAARYQVFQAFALEDQRAYYERTSDRNGKSAHQVNVWRAFFAFLTGFSAAAAGLIATTILAPGAVFFNGDCATLGQTSIVADIQARNPSLVLPEGALEAVEDEAVKAACTNWRNFAVLLLISAVVSPALGAAFTTLADLYQWDRLTGIYQDALENLEVADAQSPLADMDDVYYRASLRAMVEGTLRVMSDETAQWGQGVRTPPELKEFIDRMADEAAGISAAQAAESEREMAAALERASAAEARAQEAERQAREAEERLEAAQERRKTAEITATQVEESVEDTDTED